MPELWSDSLAAAVDAHLERTGGRAVFVACHRAVRWPLTDDAAAAAEVIGKMKHADRATTIEADTPWRDRAAVLAGCDAVLAMRYHAALFALGAGVPTVGLSYDAKVAGSDRQDRELLSPLTKTNSVAVTHLDDHREQRCGGSTAIFRRSGRAPPRFRRRPWHSTTSTSAPFTLPVLFSDVSVNHAAGQGDVRPLPMQPRHHRLRGRYFPSGRARSTARRS